MLEDVLVSSDLMHVAHRGDFHSAYMGYLESKLTNFADVAAAAAPSLSFDDRDINGRNVKFAAVASESEFSSDDSGVSDDV